MANQGNPANNNQNNPVVSDIEDLGRISDQRISMPQDIMNDMRFERGQNGEPMEVIVEDIEQKMRDMQSYIDKLGVLEQLQSQLLQAKQKDWDNVDPKKRKDEVEKVATSIERLSASTGKQLNLSRDVTQLNRQVQQLQENTEKELPGARTEVRTRRTEVGTIVNQEPQARDLVLRRQKARRENEIEENVKGMSSEELASHTTERQKKMLKNEVPQAAKAKTEQKFVTDKLKYQDNVERFKNEDLLRTTQIADADMRRRSEEDFRNLDLPKIMERGHATPEEAKDYLGGRQTKDEFLDQFGPDISAGYIRNKTTAPPVPPPNPPTPPNPTLGVDPDDTDPINVRVTNKDTDAIPMVEVGEGLRDHGSGGGPDGGGGPGIGDRSGSDDISSAFGRQEISNILAGLENVGTPGGPALAGSMLGMAGGVGRVGMQYANQGKEKVINSMIARRGLDAANPAHAEEIAALRGTIGTAALGVGAVGTAAMAGGHAYLNTAQHQRGLERTFGEDQTINMNPLAEGSGEMMTGSSLLGSQVAQRIQHPLMGGEELQELTDAMAKMGATAEEAAEALGPAADALDKYRILSPEMAARSARRGQQFSPIGGAESEVLGGVMENLSGQGFSADTLRETATTAQDVYDSVGAAGGEYAALGRTNFLSGGDNPQVDNLLQNVATQGSQGVQRVAEDPWQQSMQLTAATGNQAYMDANLGDREGQILLETAPEDIISQFDVTTLPDKDENGLPDIQSQANMRIVEASAPMALLRQNQYQYSASEFIAEAIRIQDVGGIEGVRDAARQTAEDEEGRRTAIQEDTTGVTQEKQIEASDNASLGSQLMGGIASTGGGEAGGIGGAFNNFRRAAAFATGFSSLGPQNTLDRGTLGSSSLATQEVYNNEELDPQLRAPSSIAGMDLADVRVQTEDGDVSYNEAVQDEDLSRQLAEGQQIIMKGDERLSVNELTTQARSGEIEASDQTKIGKWLWGDDQGFKKADDEGNGGKTEVFFTGEAERFFTTKDPSNPETMTGQSNAANAGRKSGTGGAELNRSGQPNPIPTR